MRIFLRLFGALFPSVFGFGGYLHTKWYWLSNERFKAIRNAMVYTYNEKVEGDYVEFGVARGRSLIYALRNAAEESERRTKFYGFDSFEGFPKPRGVDALFERFKHGEAAFSEVDALKNILKFDKNNSVKLIKGFYEDTIGKKTPQNFGIEKIRVINIDCDMYHSTILALRFIGPALQDGSVLLFDDWYCYRGRRDRGEQKALSDWLSENSHLSATSFFKYANTGKAFIINVDIEAS